MNVRFVSKAGYRRVTVILILAVDDRNTSSRQEQMPRLKVILLDD